MQRRGPPLLAMLIGFQGSTLGAAPLNWSDRGEFRVAPLAVPSLGTNGFTLLGPAQTGVWFTNELSNTQAAENQIRLIGSGVALGDVDGDGWCDLYLCGLANGNKLFRNLGNFKFADVTEAAGVACANQYSTGAALADVDGDGDLDLLVNSIGGGTRLFRNDGRGHFTEDLSAGLLRKYCSTTATLADADGDGDLDLYVANYRTTTVRSTGLEVYNIDGRLVIKSEDRDSYEMTPAGLILEHGEPDAFYLNDGRGHFTLVPWTGGVFVDDAGAPLKKAPKDWGLTAAFRDLNGDGAPDLYVCNDFWSPDRIWLNDGRGRFRPAPQHAVRHTCTFSMAVDFADINRDGLDDLLVLDMLSRDHSRRMCQRTLSAKTQPAGSVAEDRPQIDHNTLFLNRGDGTYAEIAPLAGTHASDWSWSAIFLDVDLDGFEDVLVACGHRFDTQDADAEARIAAMGSVPEAQRHLRLLKYPRLFLPKLIFRNRGNLTFEEVGASWGFSDVGVAQGMALADLDNDGDLDVVVNNLGGAAGVYRNNSSAPRVAVRLRGRAPNLRGIGAKVRVLGGPVPQSQEMQAGGRYLSCDDTVRVFAAGSITNRLRIEVAWRSGATRIVADAVANCVYEVAEPAAAAARSAPAEMQRRAEPWFADLSSRLGHRSLELPFDDAERQPMLFHTLSQRGPGVAWCDLDGDGFDDLLVGAGRGAPVILLHNDGRGGFVPLRGVEALTLTMDDANVLAWPGSPGIATLLVSDAQYEDPSLARAAIRCFELSNAGLRLKESLPSWASSLGPMAVADVDGDGDLDLFVGGRSVPGRYPEPATSRLFENDGGQFRLKKEWPALGLVSGATFSDLDGDGLPELILACEWGPVRVFKLAGGEWLEETERLGLANYRGWWNGVATGDFDGDGRLDIVASNWGRNTPYQSFLKDEWRVWYGDLNQRGSVEFIEAFVNPANHRVVPWRTLEQTVVSLPWVREKFPTCAAWGAATVEQIIGPAAARLRELRANWLDSTLFLNRGGRFEAKALPVESQFAPAFAVCIADADGDGYEDIFLGQNFFGVDGMTTRYDAGRGLLLKGDGQGGFRAVPGQESGLVVYGEQRGAAWADYDGDGRVDLVVTQNGAETRLYHNEGARPGLRVRLAGPTGNPSGIGATLRLKSGAEFGPARKVHAGSGYWSQDSAVPVMSAPKPPTELWVRWPGGKVHTARIPPGAREIAMDSTGSIRMLR